jgi:hypothetical protein
MACANFNVKKINSKVITILSKQLRKTKIIILSSPIFQSIAITPILLETFNWLQEELDNTVYNSKVVNIYN